MLHLLDLLKLFIGLLWQLPILDELVSFDIDRPYELSLLVQTLMSQFLNVF